MQDAGAFSIVLESIPAQLAELVSNKLDVPTIGIGAGVGCDGQVLVTHDMLGLFDRFTPKFVKKYTNLHGTIGEAMSSYKEDVEDGIFPAAEHSVFMKDDVWAELLEELE